MHHDSKKFSVKNRRGVSNIIGSLVVLALVASVGSVILFQGLGQINAFNYDLTFYDDTKNKELREDVIYEHVRFVNGTSDIEIYLANIGTVESTISTVTMVHNQSQEIVLAWVNPDPAMSEDGSTTIRLDSNKQINMTADLLCPFPCVTPDDWNDPYYRDDSDYNISITTSRGKFIPWTVSPWNS